MWRGCRSIMLILMTRLRKKWRREAGIGPLRRLRWMLLPVGLILSSRFNLNRRRWLRVRRGRNCQSFTWLIWRVVRRWVRQGPRVTGWKRQQVSTRVYLYWAWLSQLWPKSQQARAKTSLCRIETPAWPGSCRTP